ncbi:sugar phosphate isomerase/epimerase family protein [Ruegeria arenilitoris]|uniref:sugar phosphate isomerase/epimerase family protein n=2 Tax=Ruegeria arenilitoris TaxID=1173585 RepID=UPI0014817CB9|nr:sugar phosphate isomerase/epimerase [Ruegeria arenilitoris]
MPSISYQLYSSRDWDAEETFSMLAELGITEVEGFGPYFEDPSRTAVMLEANNLKMPTAHFSLDFVENNPERAVETAKALGIQVVVIPFLASSDRPTTAAGWKSFSERLAKASEPIVAAGLQFAWHNHEFELSPVEGVMPLDLIAAASEDIGIELDLAWVKVAGQDPVQWLERLSGKIVAVHVKDVAPQGENKDEDGWSDVGHGILDWAAIKRAMDTAGVERYIIEHDKPSDHKRMATRSLASVRAF